MMKKKHITQLALIFLCCCFLYMTNMTCQAEESYSVVASGDKDGVHWEIDTEGTMTFSGEGVVPGHFWRYSGPSADYDVSSDVYNNSEYYEPDLPLDNPWGDYVNDIRKVIINEGIVGIKGGAFSSCVNLTEVILPDSLKWINPCSFEGCKALKAIDIPESVTSIGMAAFSGSGLESITIPENVISVGSGSFAYCSDLKSVEWHGTPECVKAGTFYRCSSLELMNLPDSVTYIDSYAFSYCSNLKKIKFGENFYNIMESAFSGCSKLEEVQILTKNTSIDFGEESTESFKTVQKVIYYQQSNVSGGFDSVLNRYFKNAIQIPIDEDGNPVYSKMGASDSIKFMPKLTGISVSDNKITIAWSSVTGANYYNIYIKIGSGTWQKCASEIKGSNYTYTGKLGYTYSFTVKSVKNGKYSAHDTKGLTIKVLERPVPVSVANTSDGIRLKWTKVKGAVKYNVYRKVKGGKWCKIGYSASRNYTDIRVNAGKNYYYTVRAVCGKSISGYYDGESALNITRLTNPKITKLKKSSSGIKLTWKKVTGAKEYYIYRKTKKGTYVKVGKTSALSFMDITVKNKGTYYYTVRAKRDHSISAYNKGISHR